MSATKTITKERWKELVAINSLDTYSMVVMFGILTLWEAGVKTEEEANEVLLNKKLGLTGFQAENIIAKALGNTPDWNLGMDKE